jgi:hypothetical protein
MPHNLFVLAVCPAAVAHKAFTIDTLAELVLAGEGIWRLQMLLATASNVVFGCSSRALRFVIELAGAPCPFFEINNLIDANGMEMERKCFVGKWNEE